MTRHFNTKIVIIGASYLQLPLVIKANEMGLETHVIAWEEGAVAKEVADYFYPISIVNAEEILAVCKKIKPDGITSIASDIAVPTINYVASKLNLIGNSELCSRLTTNKFAMRKELKNHELPCPNFISLKNKSSMEDINFELLNYPAIVKPTDRSGSRGVCKVDNINELKPAIEIAFQESFAKEVIIEDFIEGKEISVETISWKGEHHFLAITDKKTTATPYFVEIEQHQPALMDDNLREKIIKLVDSSLDALDVKNGASHIEIIITPKNQLYIVEIGSRMGGDFIGSDLVYLSNGYDFLKGVIDVCLGSFKSPQQKWKKYAGVYFLCKETSYLEKYFTDDNSDFIVSKERFNLPLKRLTSSADRSGFLIYQSNKKVELFN